MLLVYDPDYMKVILGRSGEMKPISWLQQLLPLGHMPLGCEIQEETCNSAIIT